MTRAELERAPEIVAERARKIYKRKTNATSNAASACCRLKQQCSLRRPMSKQRDFVLRTIEERGVKFVRLWFTDAAGTLKSAALSPAEVEGAFSEGVGFDGSAIEGMTRVRERPDRDARPVDLSAAALAQQHRPGPRACSATCRPPTKAAAADPATC